MVGSPAMATGIAHPAYNYPGVACQQLMFQRHSPPAYSFPYNAKVLTSYGQPEQFRQQGEAIHGAHHFTGTADQLKLLRPRYEPLTEAVPFSAPDHSQTQQEEPHRVHEGLSHISPVGVRHSSARREERVAAPLEHRNLPGAFNFPPLEYEENGTFVPSRNLLHARNKPINGQIIDSSVASVDVHRSSRVTRRKNRMISESYNTDDRRKRGNDPSNNVDKDSIGLDIQIAHCDTDHAIKIRENIDDVVQKQIEESAIHTEENKNGSNPPLILRISFNPKKEESAVMHKIPSANNFDGSTDHGADCDGQHVLPVTHLTSGTTPAIRVLTGSNPKVFYESLGDLPTCQQSPSPNIEKNFNGSKLQILTAITAENPQERESPSSIVDIWGSFSVDHQQKLLQRRYDLAQISDIGCKVIRGRVYNCFNHPVCAAQRDRGMPCTRNISENSCNWHQTPLMLTMQNTINGELNSDGNLFRLSPDSGLKPLPQRKKDLRLRTADINSPAIIQRSLRWRDEERYWFLVGRTHPTYGKSPTFIMHVMGNKGIKQVQTHMQKYYERKKVPIGNRKKRTIHDIELTHPTMVAIAAKVSNEERFERLNKAARMMRD